MNVIAILKKLANIFVREVRENLNSGDYPSGADETGRGYVKIQDAINIGQVDTDGTFIEVAVGSEKAPYAKAFEFGSGEHGKKGSTYPITPVNSNALAFYWEEIGSQTIVPKGGGFKSYYASPNVFIIGKGKVDHPGIKAEPYIKPVVDSFDSKIPEVLDKAIMKKLLFGDKPQREVW